MRKMLPLQDLKISELSQDFLQKMGKKLILVHSLGYCFNMKRKEELRSLEIWGMSRSLILRLKYLEEVQEILWNIIEPLQLFYREMGISFIFFPPLLFTFLVLLYSRVSVFKTSLQFLPFSVSDLSLSTVCVSFVHGLYDQHLSKSALLKHVNKLLVSTII